MNFEKFLLKINHIKTSKLGGLDAHFKLAPKLRLQYSKEKIKANNPRKAAVLAFFFPNEENQTCFLLTQRASYKGTHSAQISFPGGKVEELDKNLAETALREASEEVGISPEEVTVIREITDVYIPPSNFLATPISGYSNHKIPFSINNEVQTTIEVLLSDLLKDENIISIKMKTSYMEEIDVPSFKLNNYIVWGATAMMLNEIKELLKETS